MAGTESTEVRVPDVGALTAEALLEASSAVRVAGDATSSFWRVRPPRQSTSDTGPVEVFTWDTRSTGLERALWMLLFPFTLLNIAHFARPVRVAPDAAWWRRVLVAAWRAVCRLLALGITATVVLGLLTVVADLVAWRCFDLAEVCGGGDAELSALFENIEMSPGRRLALALAVPALFVAFLAWVGERSWRRYEVRPAATPRDATTGGLADPLFWDRAVQVSRLRRAHVLTARATAVLVVVAPVLQEDTGSGYGLAAAGAGIAIAAGMLAAAAIAVVAWPGVGGPVRMLAARREDEVAWLLGRAQWVMTAVVAATLGYLLIPARRTWVATGPLGSVGWASRWLFLAEIVGVGVLVLLALVLVIASGRRGWRRTRQAFAGPMLAASAVALSTAACAAITYLSAQMLQGRVLPPLEAFSQNPLPPPPPPTPTPTAAAPAPPATVPPPTPSAAPEVPAPIAGLDVDLPQPYEWAAATTAAVVLAALVAGLLAWAILVRRRRGARVRAQTDQRFAGLRDWYPELAREYDEVLAGASMADWALRATAVAMVLLVGVLGFSGWAVAAGNDPTDVFADAAVVGPARVATRLGAWTAAVFAALMFAIGARAYGVSAVQRLIALPWALGTFWPRVAHPFGSPCLASRAVSELATRIEWLVAPERSGEAGGSTKDSPRGVVLVGHGHGAVLSLAALVRLTEPARRRVALVTTGAPIGWLYVRFFPAYFDPVTLARVGGPGRWVNLWRATDPMSGPVVGVGLGRPLRDPPTDAPRTGDPSWPAPLEHNDYDVDPIFVETRGRLRRLVVSEPEEGPR